MYDMDSHGLNVKLNIMINYPLNIAFNKVIINCFIMLWFLNVGAFANDAKGIEVIGQSHIDPAADEFLLTVTVAERGKMPSKLEAVVEKKINAIVNTVKQLSLNETNISTSRLNLTIIETAPSINLSGVKIKNNKKTSIYIDGQEVSDQINQGHNYQQPLFELSQKISLTFNTLEQYSQFLAYIIKIKINKVSSLSLDVKRRQQLYEKALQQALNQAKTKALYLAKTAGMTLGKVRFIKELSSISPKAKQQELMLNEDTSDVHGVLTQTRLISAKVLVKYDFKE